MNVLPKFAISDQQRRAAIEQELIRREAAIGGQLFGPVTTGRKRQFFCLDTRTWIWYEEWKDASGQQHAITTRYEVGPSGVLKSQNGKAHSRLSYEEAKNLYRAVGLYMERVRTDYRQNFAV